MKLVGLMPVRNEAWCLGFTLRVALKWCDHVVVLLHACNDVSLDILTEVSADSGSRVSWVSEDEETWDEMRHRQELLELARMGGATHIAIIDADEFLTANQLRFISGYMMSLFGSGTLLELPLYNVRELGALASGVFGMHYHANGVWGNRWIATAFQDAAALHWAGDRFHHREPMGCEWLRLRPVRQGDGGTLHLWGASERRLRAKHALYRITERLRWPAKPAAVIEKLYGLATEPTCAEAARLGFGRDWSFAQVKPEWIEPYRDLMQYLDIDAEPWQEQEIGTLLMIHGREKFAGLDLLGF